MSRIVVALGGNMLGTTPAEQAIKARKAVIPIVDLIELGHDVVQIGRASCRERVF